MLTEEKLSELRKLRTYCGELIAAHEVLAEPAPEAKEAVAVDLTAWKLSQSNRILAGSGDKAALFGTLSTEPTMDAKALATALDLYPSAAEAIVAEAVKIRAEALALDLTPKVVEVVEDIKPAEGKV
jgi:hypothetical protein